jgi:hypothetical protein
MENKTQTLLIDLGTQVAKVYYAEIYSPDGFAATRYAELHGIQAAQYAGERHLTIPEDEEYERLGNLKVSPELIIVNIKLLGEVVMPGYSVSFTIAGENFWEIGNAWDKLTKNYVFTQPAKTLKEVMADKFYPLPGKPSSLPPGKYYHDTASTEELNASRVFHQVTQ